MDYDEDPEPPNRQRDEWIEMYEKEAAKLQALRDQVKKLPVVLVEHFPETQVNNKKEAYRFRCKCGAAVIDRDVDVFMQKWAEHIWRVLFELNTLPPAPVKVFCGDVGPDHNCSLPVGHKGDFHESSMRWGTNRWPVRRR